MSVQDTMPLLRWDAGSYVHSLAVSHDGTRIFTGSGGQHVRLWDIRTGSLVLKIKGHRAAIGSVAWSHNDDRIVSGSNDGTIRVWSAHTGALISGPFRGHTDEVWSVAFSSDSTRIISGSKDKTVRMWDSRTSTPIGKPLMGHISTVSSVAFSSDGANIVSGSLDNTVRIWDVRTGVPVGAPLIGHTKGVLSIALSPDSTRIVSSSLDHTIRIWDARSCAPVGEPLRGHTDEVYSVSFSPDNTRIVSSSMDKTIRIWDAYSGAPIGESLRGHTGGVSSVAFTPDSARIVSGSDDRTLCVWEAPKNTPSFDMITSNMSAQEMFESLVTHGCADISSSVDSSQYSASAVASGGFGDVWQARMNNGMLVAVKTLRLHLILEGDPKGMKRTTRELHHWSKARHENIQELLGIVMFQGRLGMVSPWMHNGNLQQYIAKNPSVERYPLCVQVAKGVAYLHWIGMIHGDLKAVNILVSADGIAKISDFDYSMLSESTLRFSQSSRNGGGTIRWMAPELLLQEDDAPSVMRNKTTDVYALGMTMLEIISGNVPYHHYQYDLGIFNALAKKQPPKRPQELSGPEDRSTRMWALLMQCWNHDSSDRPDASTVLTLLQRIAASLFLNS